MRLLCAALAIAMSGCASTNYYVESDIPGLAGKIAEGMQSIPQHSCQPGEKVLMLSRADSNCTKAGCREKFQKKISCQKATPERR